MVRTPGDDLATRPTVVLTRGRRPARRAPLPIVAVANALWAAIYSYVPVLAVTAAVTLGGGLRYSLAAWLLAQGTPLAIDGYPFGLVPLAITALAVWRLAVAGRHAARAFPHRAVAAGGATGLAYGLIGAGAAALAQRPGLDVSPVQAGLTLAALGATVACASAAAAGGLGRRLRARVPEIVSEGVRAGAVATCLVLAAGAAAVGVAVALAGGTATQMVRDYHAGVAGQAGIVLICLLYAPNLAVWAAAYLAGPGFTLAGVPALPVFAALPSHTVSGTAQVLLATPVLAGCVAGIVTARRTAHHLRGWRLVGAAALAGPAAGVALAVAGWAAAGPLGSKVLARTGEIGWTFPVICAIGVAVGSAVAAFAASRR